MPHRIREESWRLADWETTRKSASAPGKAAAERLPGQRGKMTTLLWKLRLIFLALTCVTLPAILTLESEVLAQGTTAPDSGSGADESSPAGSSPGGTAAQAEAAEGSPAGTEGADSQAQTGAPVGTAPPTEPDSEEPAEEAEATSASATADREQTDEDMDGATYRVRLRDLEQRVDELKEQIRRSHTRLSLLSDTILSGATGGARAEIEFVNDLSGAWRVVEAVFVLDGAVQYKKTDDTGVLAAQKRIPIFSGSVPTGDHTVQVMLKLRGHGFGVFSYLRGMEATVRHDHSFTLTDGKLMDLKVIAYEQGGPTTPVEEQPSIRFNENIRNMADVPVGSPLKGEGRSGGGAEGDVKVKPGAAKVGGETSVGGGN